MTNREIAQSYFAAVGRGDIDKALALFAPGAEFVAPIGPVPFPDGARHLLKGYANAFPGHRFEVTHAIEQGAHLVLEGVWTGKHAGPLHLPDGHDLPPTQKTVRAPFVTIFSIDNGRIASHRGYWDLAGFMAQLGLGR